MRQTAILAALLVVSPVAAAETVQLSKSTYFDQHVTVADRGDHYVIHFNVNVHLEELSGGSPRLLHASVAFTRGKFDDVSRMKRSVRLTRNDEQWSFYFRVPKFSGGMAETVYAVIAEVDGIPGAGSAVCIFQGNKVDMGSRENPLWMTYPVGATVQKENPDGSFKLTVVYETIAYVNNYDDLPMLGFVQSGKSVPEVIEGERSAKRLDP